MIALDMEAKLDQDEDVAQNFKSGQLLLGFKLIPLGGLVHSPDDNLLLGIVNYSFVSILV